MSSTPREGFRRDEIFAQQTRPYDLHPYGPRRSSSVSARHAPSVAQNPTEEKFCRDAIFKQPTYQYPSHHNSVQRSPPPPPSFVTRFAPPPPSQTEGAFRRDEIFNSPMIRHHTTTVATEETFRRDAIFTGGPILAGLDTYRLKITCTGFRGGSMSLGIVNDSSFDYGDGLITLQTDSGSFITAENGVRVRALASGSKTDVTLRCRAHVTPHMDSTRTSLTVVYATTGHEPMTFAVSHPRCVINVHHMGSSSVGEAQLRFFPGVTWWHVSQGERGGGSSVNGILFLCHLVDYESVKILRETMRKVPSRVPCANLVTMEASHEHRTERNFRDLCFATGTLRDMEIIGRLVLEAMVGP